MKIQELTKSSSYKYVQTHIFEMWRPLMFLDVNKFRTGRVSNTMAFYTVLMWGKRLIFVHFHKDYLLENECITKLNLTSEQVQYSIKPASTV